jgi:hypothetical protein
VIASSGVQRWRVVERGDRERTRWPADAEADHSGGVTRAEGGAHGPGAGAAVAKAVALADRDTGDGARSGKDDARAGGAGHAPQTEPAESEAVSGDRTRPPPAKGPTAELTGAARAAVGHRRTAWGFPPDSEGNPRRFGAEVWG